MVTRVALTGGIASGKSMVSEMLARYDIPVIDADQITHQLYAESDELKQLIRRTFGDEVFDEDGAVNRRKVGEVAFNQPEKLRVLTDWIHPQVRQTIDVFFAVHQEKKLAVAVIPVLYESGIEDRYDEVWVVWATPEQQLERLIQYRGYGRDEALSRINAQMPLEEKARRAHRVIQNHESPEQTRLLLQEFLMSIS